MAESQGVGQPIRLNSSSPPRTSGWLAASCLLLVAVTAVAWILAAGLVAANDLPWGERCWLGLLCFVTLALGAGGLLALAALSHWLWSRFTPPRCQRPPPWVQVAAVLAAVMVPAIVGWGTGGALPFALLVALAGLAWLCCGALLRRARLLDWRPLVAVTVSLMVLWGVVARVSSSSAEARRQGEEELFHQVTAGLRVNGQRLLVIGLDGFSWQFFSAMRQRGELPNLSRLAGLGVAGPLGSLRPTESARLWTTVASGETAERHGVASFFSYVLPGIGKPLIARWPNGSGLPRLLDLAVSRGWARREPVSSYNCSSPRFWEIVEAAGGRAAVLGWWATWPAHAARGVVVSDTFYYHYGGRDKPPRLGLEGAGGAVYPSTLKVELEGLRRSPHSVGEAEIERFFARPMERLEELRNSSWLPTVDDQFLYLFSMDRTYADLAQHLLRRQPDLDLMVVYLRGVDTLSHLALEFGTPLDPASPGSAADLVRAYYVFTDQLVGELVAAAGAGRGVLVLSDHGFARDDVGRWGHDDAPPGVLLAAGSGLASGRRITEVDLYDIFPTVLRFFGLPRVAGQSGESLAIYGAELASPPPPLPSYGRPPRAAPADLAVGEKAREEEVERLRSLGYGG